MTVLSLENEPVADGELVAACLAGDRQAFGRLVRRYQGMICGLIYAYCGDLHRSEDLAQETFVAAWKSLSTLREPKKLAPWLCQIARRRALDELRDGVREQTTLNRLGEMRPARDSVAPDEEALSAEERELLWKMLSGLAQPYRETMVLFYRQGQSAAAVAEAMETTEAAVRERLVRGRRMLREQVAAALENNLVRSAPSPAFAVAVLAALPAVIPQAAKAATLGAAAKSSAAVTGGTLSLLIGPMTAVIAGALGLRAGLRGATSDRERSLLRKFGFFLALAVCLGILALWQVPAICRHFKLSGSSFMLVLAASWLLYTLPIALLSRWTWRRQRVLRRESRGEQPGVESSPCQSARMPGWLMAATTIGCTAWMMDLAWKSHDIPALAILAIATVAFLVGGVRAFAKNRTADVARRAILIYITAMGLFTTAMVHWRLQFWIAAERGVRLADIQSQMPIWSLDVLVITLFFCGLLLAWSSTGSATKGH